MTEPKNPMSIQAFLADNPSWTLVDDSLRRTFSFKDFRAALGWVVQVGCLAEAADHHPDLDIRWNRVTVVLSTHSAGGINQKDLVLASQINHIGTPSV